MTRAHSESATRLFQAVREAFATNFRDQFSVFDYSFDSKEPCHKHGECYMNNGGATGPSGPEPLRATIRW